MSRSSNKTRCVALILSLALISVPVLAGEGASGPGLVDGVFVLVGPLVPTVLVVPFRILGPVDTIAAPRARETAPDQCDVGGVAPLAC